MCLTHSIAELDSVADNLLPSIVEGIRGSLERLGMQYVDIVYALCPDSTGKE